MEQLKDDRELILRFLNKIKENITRESLVQGRVATRKTIESLQPLVTSALGGILQANQNIINTEIGVSPAEAQKESFLTLVEGLRVWKIAKGLPDKLNEYALAHSLRKFGSRLWREGGHSGVLTNFIREDNVNEFTQTLANKYLQESNSILFNP